MCWGGKAKQILFEMTKQMHKELHQDLRKFLQEHYPSCEPKRGNDSQKIIDNHGKVFLKNVQGEFYKTYYDKYKKVADFFNNGQYEK